MYLFKSSIRKQIIAKRFVENYQKTTKRFVVFHKGITKKFVEYYNISALHNIHIQGGQSYD